jgi:hypothetical protein
MARVRAIRIASFLILTACAAPCQQPKVRASLDSLPDAPLPHVASAVGSLSDALPRLYSTSQSWKTGGLDSWSEWHLSFKEDHGIDDRNENDEFRRQLVSLLQHRATYQPSSENGLMTRAFSAALGTFLTRDPSGRTRLKTSYVLGVLTSAVIHTAYRPYWNRPVSAPFSDFGSRVGNDAGMNLLHEFRPGLEELMKSHTPKFLSRIAASIEHK